MLGGFIYSLISMFSFGIGNLLWKVPQKSLPIYKIITIRSFITTSLFLITILLYSSFSINLNGWLIAIGISAFSFFGLFFYNVSLKHTQVSQSITITSVGAVFGVLTSLIVYNEVFSWYLVGSLTLIVLGLFLLEDKKPILKWSKGTNYALLASFFWGTSFALFRIPIEKIGSVNFSFSLEFTVCLMAILIGLFTKEKQKNKISKQAIYTIVVLAILGYLGVVFYNKAITIIPVSTLSIMGTFTPVITIIISHIYLKEKFNKNQYLGIASIIGASLLLI